MSKSTKILASVFAMMVMITTIVMMNNLGNVQGSDNSATTSESPF